MRPIRFGCPSSGDFLHKLNNGVTFNYSGKVTANEITHPLTYVVLYNHDNYSPLSIQHVDAMGNYCFNGLQSSTTYYALAFDITQQFNIAVQTAIRYNP